MAEYYSLLKKAVAGLEAGSEDIRRSIYDKARQALVGQLKSINPPLTTAEISRQRLELEEAIRKVERESTQPVVRDARSDAINAATRAMEAAIMPPSTRARLPAASPASPAPSPTNRAVMPSARSATPPVTPAPPSTTPASPADREADHAQAVFRRAMQDAADRGRAPSRPVPVPDADHVDTQLGPLPLDPPVPDPSAAGPERDVGLSRPLMRPDPEAEGRPGSRSPVATPAGSRQLAAGGPSVVEDWQPEPEAAVADAAAPPRRGRGKAAEGRRVPDPPRDYYDGSARPSRLPSLIISGLVLAVVLAVAMLGWTYRSDLVDFVASLTGDDPRVLEEGKDNARLGDTPAAAPPVPAAANVPPVVPPTRPAPPSDRIRIVDALPPAPGAPSAVSNRSPAAFDTPAPAAVPPPAAVGDPPAAIALAAPPPATPLADGPAAAIAVGQRAMLHEEQPAGAQQTVVVTPGAVVWRFDPAGPNGPALTALIDLPDRNAHVEMTIRRNTDSGFLPASHLIEVTVTMAPGDPTGGVQSIPSLVMKTSEEARGTQLVGQSIKITDEVFWIALSAVDAQTIAANTATLRDQAWFDLPLLYANGQRAILTFEKGAPGQQVFAEALAAWAG